MAQQQSTVDWLLSDTRNFDQIPEKIQEAIYKETASYLNQFQEISSKKFPNLSFQTDKNCKQYVNANLYTQLTNSGLSPREAKIMATGVRCDKVDNKGLSFKNIRASKNKFSIDYKLKEKSLTWDDVKVRYDYDYLRIADAGIIKNDLEKYTISQKISGTVHLFPDTNKFEISVYWNKGKIDSQWTFDGNWSSDEEMIDLLSLHGIESRKEILKGTYSFPVFTIFDVYRMNKYYEISKKRTTTYKGPKVIFNINESGKSFSIPLWRINDGEFAQLAKKYANAIEFKLDDMDEIEAIKDLHFKSKKNQAEEEKARETLRRKALNKKYAAERAQEAQEAQEAAKKRAKEPKFIPYDDPPRPLVAIRPVYPDIAQEAGIEGQVLVQCFIDKTGKVKETIILKGIPNTGLNEAAVDALRKTEFRPAKQRGTNVGVWITLPINFKLPEKTKKKR